EAAGRRHVVLRSQQGPRRAGQAEAARGGRGAQGRCAVKAGALCAVLLAASPAAAADIVIRGARIVPVDGPLIENGTLVISGGKIASLGRDAATPAGAQVVDGTGKTLYPGL